MAIDTTAPSRAKTLERLPTGITGLDEVLDGGLIARRAYLVRGGPGSGKTSLGLHFLAAGAAAGAPVLCITLEESEEQLRADARAQGLDLEDVTFLDLSPGSEFFAKAQSYDIFSPAEVEHEPTTQRIVERVETLRPRRVFLEAMTQFRYLTPDAFQFHKQVLSFLRYLTDKGATVLFSSETSAAAPDDDLQFVADGVINLATNTVGRTVTVTKLRGSDFRAGPHSMRLTRRGLEVFPRLIPERHARGFVPQIVSSGVPALDRMLHGGLERGTATIITGPSGVGKTTLGMQFMKEAAGRGENSVIFLFEEGRESLIRRCEAINIPVHAMIERGTLTLLPIEPLLYSADEFASLVRREVEERNARIVMLDSLAGYNLCIRGEGLVSHLHALTRYLKNMGATALLINEVEKITGDFRATELGISYLADNIIFLRYLEIAGELRKALGVLKKRLSKFERGLRELEITRYGLRLGRPLTELRGILTGVPTMREPKRRRAAVKKPPKPKRRNDRDGAP